MESIGGVRLPIYMGEAMMSCSKSSAVISWKSSGIGQPTVLWQARQSMQGEILL